MNANVIHITDSLIDDFRKRKILQETEGDLDLEPVAGMPVVGYLTEPEKLIFIEVCCLETDLNDRLRELFAKHLETAAGYARESEGLMDVLRRIMETAPLDKTDAEELNYDMARLDYLKGFFWFSLRERLQTFASRLSVRAGYAVVRTGYKYKE